VANVSNVVIGPKGTNVHENASGASLQNASVQFLVSANGPTCSYSIQYIDPAQWTVTGDGGTNTISGPLGITTVVRDLPLPSDSGWVLSDTLSIPAATSILVSSNPNQYIPSTGVGAEIASLYPAATFAKVTYRIAQQR
jgi:hypothetical protein